MSELKPYSGVRCMCLVTGCIAGPGCPHYTGHCKAHIQHQNAQPAQAGQVLSDELIKNEALEAFSCQWDADDETLVNKYGHGVYLWRFIDFARAIEAAVLAKRVPMTDQEIIDAAEAIKVRRIEASKQAVLGRKGSKCSRCGGVIGVHSNGYHMFNRCESCDHVPMFNIDGVEYRHHGIVGKEGA